MLAGTEGSKLTTYDQTVVVDRRSLQPARIRIIDYLIKSWNMFHVRLTADHLITRNHFGKIILVKCTEIAEN